MDFMIKQLIGIVAIILLVSTTVWSQDQIKWEVLEIQEGGRIDAIADFGNGVVILGTRDPNSGNVYRSEDYGRTWSKVGNITGKDQITCIASDKNGVGYILTGNTVTIWKTLDYGKTWKNLGKISNAVNRHWANAYGCLVSDKGTVLAADNDAKGGRIIRSEDGGSSWKTIGPISSKGLYRLNMVGDGIIVNGWAGNVYKSNDDGLTWKDVGEISNSYLYAIDYLGKGQVLIGTESGHVLKSFDNGDTWEDQGIIGDAADDFVAFSNGNVLFTTYKQEKEIFFSTDYGESWNSVGKVPTGKTEDWLDHVIWIQDKNNDIIVGGTNKGYLLRAEWARQ